MKFIFSVLTVFLCQFLHGEITETGQIEDIKKQATEGTLVLLNVTGTMYEPAMVLADNQWRIAFASKVHALVPDQQVAERLINKIKNDIVTYLPKKSVEPSTPALVQELQNKHIPVLGITQKQVNAPYAENFGLITAKHLASVGIDLEKTLSFFNVNDKENSNYTLAHGLIFTNKGPVGPAIVAFVNNLQNKPKKVIMVDNSLDSLEEAQSALKQTGIDFIGFRYNRGEARKSSFDQVIGDIQFLAFIKDRTILTDEQAQAVKDAHPNTDYSALVDQFIREQVR